MKKLLLLFLLFPLGLAGQYKDPIPKRASQIFIGNDKTADENFIYVSKFLVREAINIEDRDKDLAVITTEVFRRGKLHPVSLTFFCEDNSIRVTGKFKLGMDLDFGSIIAKDDFQKIENRGMRGSIFNKAFRAMDEIAHELGTQIIYN